MFFNHVTPTSEPVTLASFGVAAGIDGGRRRLQCDDNRGETIVVDGPTARRSRVLRRPHGKITENRLVSKTAPVKRVNEPGESIGVFDSYFRSLALISSVAQTTLRAN